MSQVEQEAAEPGAIEAVEPVERAAITFPDMLEELELVAARGERRCLLTPGP